MRGDCIIDGTDIATLGIFIVRDGDNDFISFPKRKEPENNDWYEYDGMDADLTEHCFKEKTVEVRFHITDLAHGRLEERLYGFFDLVSAPGIHTVYVRAFKRPFRLRSLAVPDMQQKGGLVKPGSKSATFTVRFSMDAPMQLFTTGDPRPSAPYRGMTYVEIDGKDLALFGIIVSECYSAVLPYPARKKPLTIAERRMTGLVAYPPQTATFDVKQIAVSCTMRAHSTEEFYRNWEALFRSLTTSDTLTLATFPGDEECFYASMENFRKKAPFSRRPVVTFELYFTCTESAAANILLATENGELIILEDGDGDNVFIDMKEYGN